MDAPSLPQLNLLVGSKSCRDRSDRNNLRSNLFSRLIVVLVRACHQLKKRAFFGLLTTLLRRKITSVATAMQNIFLLTSRQNTLQKHSSLQLMTRPSFRHLFKEIQPQKENNRPS